ncbi:MAG TPA: HAD-IIB family hydrolase [Steroidobacteraceae bacterium]|jgi:HAD superfamily hydrolase (TIGR01484 family)|nr:HAD-IIB family hydrolase [Steroidobacteraceae bacterium]
MRYLALCCDYDGTIAHHGRVDEPTIAALERLRESGRRLVLVTGRELDQLQEVMPRLDLFARVVAENGALLYRPETREERLLGEAPSQSFVDMLIERGVGPISVGRVIVATWEPHENTVLKTIRDCGLELQVIFNKGAVMVLPAGINKATGLRAALAELNLSPHNAVAVGDAENDHAFFNICECAVAVANALPAVKEKADIVTFKDHGAGVVQLIDEMLADDLASREGGSLARHDIPLGKSAQGKRIALSPFRTSALVVGTSGGGKSTVVAGLVERLREAGYNFCIIDPEGDYDSVEAAVVLGNPEHAPTIDECVQLLNKPDQNAVVNLLGVKLEDRPWFFLSLFARIRELRARTGRPHWLIVDEAHHAMPANWRPTDQTLPEHLDGVLAVSVSPKLVAPSVLRALDTIVVLGDRPREMLREFTDGNRIGPVDGGPEALEAGTALLWNKTAGGEPTLVRLEPSRTERRRHLRKYAEGELPEDRSFYFRGPEGKLNLRAHNLILFMDLADGVDDDTWQFHLRRGEISQWLRRGIKDETLATQVAAIERNEHLDAGASRRKLRELIEATYTLPAQ